MTLSLASNLWRIMRDKGWATYISIVFLSGRVILISAKNVNKNSPT